MDTEITKFTPTQYEILKGFSKAMDDLGAGAGLISIIMSWGDTMDDESTLQMINDYNAGRFGVKTPQQG